MMFVLVVATGCKPRFEHTGNLTVGGTAFHPVGCHVRNSCTGIDLVDHDGRRLELTLPPQTLRAWESIGGTAHVRWISGPVASSIDLGPCGMLTLRGQGYHGDGKRAASGHLSLACASAPSAKGALDLSGCF
jgi:hypothetical protein